MRIEKPKKKLVGLPACWYGVCLNEWGNGWDSLEAVVERSHELILLAVNMSGLAAVILLIYGGITFIMAGGDAEKIEKGTNIIRDAMIGLVIIFIARMIIVFVIDKIIGA